MYIQTLLLLTIPLLTPTLAIPLAEPEPNANNEKCTTIYKTITKTSTKAQTSTTTAGCPIISLPLSPLVTGTIIPIGSITSDLANLLKEREADPTPAPAPFGEYLEEDDDDDDDVVLIERDGKKCTACVTSTKWVTTSTKATTTVSNTGCPILSLPLSPLVTGTILPVGSVVSEVGAVLTGREAVPTLV